MNDIVTFKELLDINNTITVNAKKQQEYNKLLDERVCRNYDILDEKRKLLNLLLKFSSARYVYDFPIENNIKISPVYEERLGTSQRSTASQVENAVSKYLDKMIATTNVYKSLIKVSYNLTNDEAIYLINTFLDHKSEEKIADIIGISKTYLQKIKKSCIVKMWAILKVYCEEDE